MAKRRDSSSPPENGKVIQFPSEPQPASRRKRSQAETFAKPKKATKPAKAGGAATASAGNARRSTRQPAAASDELRDIVRELSAMPGAAADRSAEAERGDQPPRTIHGLARYRQPSGRRPEVDQAATAHAPGNVTDGEIIPAGDWIAKYLPPDDGRNAWRRETYELYGSQDDPAKNRQIQRDFVQQEETARRVNRQERRAILFHSSLAVAFVILFGIAFGFDTELSVLSWLAARLSEYTTYRIFAGFGAAAILFYWIYSAATWIEKAYFSEPVRVSFPQPAPARWVPPPGHGQYAIQDFVEPMPFGDAGLASDINSIGTALSGNRDRDFAPKFRE